MDLNTTTTSVLLKNLQMYYVHQPAKQRQDDTILLIKEPILTMESPDIILRVSSEKVISKISVPKVCNL